MRKILVATVVWAVLLMGLAGSLVSTVAQRQAVTSPQAVTLAAPDPNTCVGYPEPRVGVEIQAWWQSAVGEAYPGRHTHLFTCWPTGVVTGTVHLDLKLQTHAQPPGAKVTRVRATDGGGADVFPAITSGFNAIDANGNLLQWLTADINTTGLSAGLHEIRLAAYTQANVQQLVSSDLPLFVRSLSGGATSRDYVEARGWYPDPWGYLNARYQKRLADFLTPKSGIWSVTFQCTSPSGATADHFIVTLDPNFHNLFAGKIVHESFAESTKTIDIDTTQLADGPHKVVALCGGTHDFGGALNGTDTGVLAINFMVQNGLSATPVPTPSPIITPEPTPVPTPVITPSLAPSGCVSP